MLNFWEKIFQLIIFLLIQNILRFLTLRFPNLEEFSEILHIYISKKHINDTQKLCSLYKKSISIIQEVKCTPLINRSSTSFKIVNFVIQFPLTIPMLFPQKAISFLCIIHMHRENIRSVFVPKVDDRFCYWILNRFR